MLLTLETQEQWCPSMQAPKSESSLVTTSQMTSLRRSGSRQLEVRSTGLRLLPKPQLTLERKTSMYKDHWESSQVAFPYPRLLVTLKQRGQGMVATLTSLCANLISQVSKFRITLTLLWLVAMASLRGWIIETVLMWFGIVFPNRSIFSKRCQTEIQPPRKEEREMRAKRDRRKVEEVRRRSMVDPNTTSTKQLPMALRSSLELQQQVDH